MPLKEKPAVGVVGLGKLGLPLAVTLAMAGFAVLGYDRDDSRMTPDALTDWELDTSGSGPLLKEYAATPGTDLRFVGLESVVDGADCVLVAVETPHELLYEGVTPLPLTRADFDYTVLRAAVGEIARGARRPITIGIISTVLPGTIRRDIAPIAAGHKLVYCPQFIAMGHVAQDFRRPEFILIGTDSDDRVVENVLGTLAPEAPVKRMRIESAELTKTIYNTYLSTKVAISNLIQQVSGMTGADAREVFDAVGQANRRITSSAYIGPGLGDGGPCHPRDNIALSWLVRDLGLTTDLFTAVMDVRQGYTAWLANGFVARAGELPLVILGTGYKPGVPLETGSAAVLLAHLLRAWGIAFEVVPVPGGEPLSAVAAYFIGCPEPAFYQAGFPSGSVVFDPWYRAAGNPGVEVVFPGSEVDGRPGRSGRP